MSLQQNIWILEQRTYDGECTDTRYFRTRERAIEYALAHIEANMPRSRRGRTDRLSECKLELERDGKTSEYYIYAILHAEFTK